MQAAAEAEAAASGGGAGDGSSSRFEPEKDALWTMQRDLAMRMDLARNIDLSFHANAPPVDGGGGDGAAKGRFKWKTALDDTFTFNFATASPREDVATIDWSSEVRGVERSEAGAEGVFFVETTKGAVVLKGSRSMAGECFSALLGLELGIFSPQWRIIATGAGEGTAMVKFLGEADPSGRVTVNLKAQTHVLLKGYLPGVNFGQLKANRAIEVFGPPGMLSKGGAERCREIGRILALDVLCNNGDRFPLIWENRGNPGNVMLAHGCGQAVSIDSQIQPIDGTSHPAELEAYLARVRELTVALKAAGDASECAAFKSVREKIAEYCGHDLGDRGTLAMQEGFRAAVATPRCTALEAWRNAFQELKPAVVGLEGLDIAFVNKVWDALLA